MNPMEAILQQLSAQAGPRGFTYLGRVAQPGITLGDLLSQRSLIGDMDEGNAKAIQSDNKMFIPTKIPAVNQYKNIASNISNMAGAANANNLPTSNQVIDRANADQSQILNYLSNLYNSIMGMSK